MRAPRASRHEERISRERPRWKRCVQVDVDTFVIGTRPVSQERTFRRSLQHLALDGVFTAMTRADESVASAIDLAALMHASCRQRSERSVRPTAHMHRQIAARDFDERRVASAEFSAIDRDAIALDGRRSVSRTTAAVSNTGSAMRPMPATPEMASAPASTFCRNARRVIPSRQSDSFIVITVSEGKRAVVPAAQRSVH